jgi:GTPase Era involved in 16S rRNA processing
MVLDQKIIGIRGKLADTLASLHDLTKEISNKELVQTVSDLRLYVGEQFMFVIVGEVKAGKSSFINALLSTDKEICKVAPQPMTDTIQQIVYGTDEETVDINPYLKKIFQPIDILKEISIVDTPGTNTIIEHHQEITERFIPAADLIVFVFESKNPYRQSAWDFFKYIHKDWHRKIIFVLQQKDLMDPSDLEVNVGGVRDYAIKEGVEEPLIFAVSAKDEQEGKQGISGFTPLRNYIQENITGGKALILKMENTARTLDQINERIRSGLDTRIKQYEEDLKFRKDIDETLNYHEIKANNQIGMLVENLVAAYDRTTIEVENDLKEGFSFIPLLKRSFRSIFSKAESAKVWLESLSSKLEKGLNEELNRKLNEGVDDAADSIQQMARVVDLKIKGSNTILKNDHELFSDIAEKRLRVLDDLRQTFSEFIQDSENFTDYDLFPGGKNITPNIATGSGLAIIGVILATVTNGMVFDVTGGILTTIGLLFASVTVGIKRKKILNGYKDEIERGRDKLQGDIKESLKQYIGNLKQKIQQNFSKFDQMLKLEGEQIERFESAQSRIQSNLHSVHTEIEELER